MKTGATYKIAEYTFAGVMLFLPDSHNVPVYPGIQ